LFKGIRWSTQYSFQDLVKNAGKKGTFMLKIKNDLNVPDDILMMKKEIFYNCPTLHSFLQNQDYYLSLGHEYIDFDNLSICIPVVSNLVQRKSKKRVEILVQKRHKPRIDPQNMDKLEIPSGLIHKYELAQDAAIRETKEETGVTSEIDKRHQVIRYIKQKNGNNIAVYKPFFCQQQLRGDRSYLSLAFISNYVRGSLEENTKETREVEWISLSRLKKIVKKEPNNIFGLSLAVLSSYLEKKS